MSSKRKKEKEERGSGKGCLSVEEILEVEGPPQKQKRKKGKTGEKAFLSRVRGKWTGFRSRAAFGRSDRNWNSGNRDWTGRQLRLSPFRTRILSPQRVLLPATRLWVLRRTVIRFASRASSVFPAKSLGGPNQHELTRSFLVCLCFSVASQPGVEPWLRIDW
jgi:hypothetical protein